MDPIVLLLADPSPALRYRALRELANKPADDPDVVTLAGQLASSPEVARILGSRSGGTQALSYALSRLAFVGVRRGNPSVDAMAERIFAAQSTDGSWARVRGDTNSWHPLETGLALRGLAAAGYATDPRAEQAYDYLIECRLEDGSWASHLKTPGARPRPIPGYRRMEQSEGCRAQTTAALACFALHPERRSSPEPRSGLDVLMRRATREQTTLGFEVARLLGAERAGGHATFYAVFDLVFIFHLATRLGMSTSDQRMADLAAFIESKRGPQGLWQHPTHPQLSRWLTLDILTSLRHLDTADWVGSEYTQPFTAYPKRHRRY